MADTDGMTRRWMWLAALIAASGCKVKDPLFCDDTHPCTSLDRPYCDRTGDYDPDRIKNSCVPDPFGGDGGLVDAAPGTITLDVANDRFFLRRDGSVSVPVSISRGTGVDGPVAITVEAPPSGVTFDALSIPAGSTTGMLVAHGATDATYARTAVAVKAVAGGAVGHDALDLDVIGKPGDVDTTFGGGGQVALPMTGFGSLLEQGDRVVVVGTAKQLGNSGAYATRLLESGAIDPTFGANGTYFDDFSTIGLSNTSVVAAVQSTGKIILAGSGSNGSNGDPVIVRLTADGQIDPSMQAHRVDTSANDDAITRLAVDGQDDIFLAGLTGSSSNTDVLIMRLSPDGQLDLSFAAGRLTFGTPENEVLDSVAAMPDRGVLVDAGTCGQLGCGSGIQRYGASGVLDTTFANKGNLGPKAMSGYASVYGAGLVTATSFMAWGTDQGSASPAVAVWMFSLAGQPDDQFGTAGLYEPTPADSRERGIVDAAAMPDGRRLFVGYDATSNSSFDYHLSMLMLLPNGSPDPTVGAGGVMRDAAVVFLPAHVAVRADHRVAVLGTLNPVTMGQVVVRTYFW